MARLLLPSPLGPHEAYPEASNGLAEVVHANNPPNFPSYRLAKGDPSQCREGCLSQCSSRHESRGGHAKKAHPGECVFWVIEVILHLAIYVAM